MTKQIILPLIPREGITPKPFEDLLSAIVGLLRAYGYSDQYAIEINGGWHPVSELPPEDSDEFITLRIGYSSNTYGIARFSKYAMQIYDHVDANTFYVDDANGYNYSIPVDFWQPLPEPPETKEDNDNV